MVTEAARGPPWVVWNQLAHPPAPRACKCLAACFNICPALAASSHTPTTSVYSATCKLEKSCSHSVSPSQIKPQAFGSPESPTIKLREGLCFVRSSSVRLPGCPANLLTPGPHVASDHQERDTPPFPESPSLPSMASNFCPRPQWVNFNKIKALCLNFQSCSCICPAHFQQADLSQLSESFDWITNSQWEFRMRTSRESKAERQSEPS